MRGFRARSSLRRSCRRPSADETKLPVAREKKPLVPRVCRQAFEREIRPVVLNA